MRLTPISSLHLSPPLKLCLPNGTETLPRVPSLTAWLGCPTAPVLRQILGPCDSSVHALDPWEWPWHPSLPLQPLSPALWGFAALHRVHRGVALHLLQCLRELRGANGEELMERTVLCGCAGIRHSRTPGTGARGLWQPCALAREAVAPWVSVPEGCCDGEQESQLLPYPRAGSWAAPSTWELLCGEITLPSWRAVGCAAQAEMSRRG